MVVLGAGAVSYERGTPAGVVVGCEGPDDSSRLVSPTHTVEHEGFVPTKIPGLRDGGCVVCPNKRLNEQSTPTPHRLLTPHSHCSLAARPTVPIP